MIAFTNHALDHMLTSVLDAKITDNIVRLGSRSADERISQYSIESKEMVVGRSALDRSFGQRHRALKTIEEDIRKHMQKLLKTTVDPEDIISYLDLSQPDPYDSLMNPPTWIHTHRSLTSQGDGDNGQWQHVGTQGRTVAEDNSLYTYWRYGRDLDFLRTPPPVAPPALHTLQSTIQPNRYDILAEGGEEQDSSSEGSNEGSDNENSVEEEEPFWMQSFSVDLDDASSDEVTRENVPAPTQSLVNDHQEPTMPDKNALSFEDLQDVEGFFHALGLSYTPVVPTTNRSIDDLLVSDDPWNMSYAERNRLHTHWEAIIREESFTQGLDDFKRLRDKHAAAQQAYDEGKNEVCETIHHGHRCFHSMVCMASVGGSCSPK